MRGVIYVLVSTAVLFSGCREGDKDRKEPDGSTTPETGNEGTDPEPTGERLPPVNPNPPAPGRSHDSLFPDPELEPFPLMDRYVVARKALKAELESFPPSSEVCPPSPITLMNGKAFKRTDKTHRAKGIYYYENKMVVKAVTERRQTPEVQKGLLNEKAFLSSLWGYDSALVEHMLQFHKEGLSPYCRAHLVAAYERWDTLSAFVSVEGSPPELGSVAKRMLELVKKFHSKGFVHGQIAPENVFAGKRISNFYLINFIETVPYVDKFGKHVVGSHESGSTDFGLFSPWKLEQSPYQVTRRDDMFGLAETLFKLYVPAYAKAATDGEEKILTRSEWAQFKRDHNKYGAPQVLNDFYAYTLTLDRETTPDYDLWINKFT